MIQPIEQIQTFGLGRCNLGMELCGLSRRKHSTAKEFVGRLCLHLNDGISLGLSIFMRPILFGSSPVPTI